MTTSQPVSTKNFARSDLLLPAVYGIQVLTALWAFAGGADSLFWSRQYVLGAVMCALVFISYRLQGLPFTFFQIKKQEFRMGLLAGLATALPVLIALFLVKHDHAEHPWIQTLMPTGLGAVIFFAFIVSASAEFIMRGILQPTWTLSGVAFLDALTIGFGMQVFVTFAAFWLMGLFWGKLATRNGLNTAVVCRVAWSLFVGLGLLYL